MRVCGDLCVDLRLYARISSFMDFSSVLCVNNRIYAFLAISAPLRMGSDDDKRGKTRDVANNLKYEVVFRGNLHGRDSSGETVS